MGLINAEFISLKIAKNNFQKSQVLRWNIVKKAVAK